jgi:hypothetical protein
MGLLPGNKLRNGEGGRLTFMCPGCKTRHTIAVGEGPGQRWGWNGDTERPVFTPSVLVTYDGCDAGKDGAPPAVCHSFVGCNGAQPGQIVFLGDCTHSLAGQTVDLPAFPPLPL